MIMTIPMTPTPNDNDAAKSLSDSGKFRTKHQRVVRLSLRASGLLPINFVLKQDVFFTILIVLQFEIANVIPEHNLGGSKPSIYML